MTTEAVEGMYELLQRRDAEISVLREYIESLEEELRVARGEDAHERARDDADERIRDLRYQSGLKTDGRFRG